MRELVSKSLGKIRKDGIVSFVSTLQSAVWKKFRPKYWSLANSLCFEKTSPVDEYIYVDPGKINHYLLQSEQTPRRHKEYQEIAIHKREKGYFRPDRYAGVVVDGDWDVQKKQYRYDRVYAGYKQWYDHGDDLAESEFIHQYEMRGQIREDSEYAQRVLQEKKSLFEKIEEEGFRTQYETGEKQRGTPLNSYPWSITVNIGRDGMFIFNNTAHNRLAISKLLEVEEIPVLVVVRHSEWHAIREEIKAASTPTELSATAQEHLDHPDLQRFVDESWVQSAADDDSYPVADTISQ